MTPDRRNHWPVTIIIVSLLLVAGVAGIVLLNNKMQNERQERSILEQQRRENQAKRDKAGDEGSRLIMLNGCISDAQDSYKADWEDDVKHLGSKDNRLPEGYAKVHEDRLQRSKDDCYKKWQ